MEMTLLKFADSTWLFCPRKLAPLGKVLGLSPYLILSFGPVHSGIAFCHPYFCSMFWFGIIRDAQLGDGGSSK
jgi:hypothetical protein